MTNPDQPDIRWDPPADPVERRRQLNERLRAEFVAGAEVQSRRSLGRGLTADELRRVLEHYPGDLPDAQG